jgi:hypothetical protein
MHTEFSTRNKQRTQFQGDFFGILETFCVGVRIIVNYIVYSL